MNKYIQKLLFIKGIIVENSLGLYKRIMASVRQIIVSIVSLLVLFTCFVNIMDASSQEVDNDFLDSVIEYNKNSIPEIDRKLLLISNEVLIKEKVGFIPGIHLSDTAQLNFIAIGQGTLITGKDISNRMVILTVKNGKSCTAKTNADGKFGCMFPDTILTSENIRAEYK